MAAIRRRVLGNKVPASTILCAADDLDGAATTLVVTGSNRVIYAQIANGTAGTAGIDTIQVSHDGGSSYAADNTLLALASDDQTGTVVVNGILNAAGIEPTGAAFFKGGPYVGPTLVRCARLSTDDANSAAWVTGAPAVHAIIVGA